MTHAPRSALSHARGRLLKAALWLLPAACGAMAACGVGPDRVAVTALVADAQQRPGLACAPTLLAYRSDDAGQAELLATDLEAADLDPATPLEAITGQITRVRMFAVPIRGRTPQSSAAANAVVQHAVLNEGVLAVYAGAGLLRPEQRPGGPTLAAAMAAGSLRLTRASEGFIDPIGPARVDLALTADRNAALARLIAGRLDDVLAATHPVDQGEDRDAHSESTTEATPR